MSWTSEHLSWLADTGGRISTADGKTIEVWEFRHNNDDAILSAWAKHFRNHYCLDSEIEALRSGTGLSRSHYLTNIKFPDAKTAPGPSIRAGDFGEILVADYLEYRLGYWVPRTRYGDKTVRNESKKGCDIIGFKYLKDGMVSNNDVLAIYESKTQFTGSKAAPRLQDAIEGSAKDQLRKAESLNAIKNRLIDKGKLQEAIKVERFQDFEDRPYKEVFGAVALFSSNLLDEATLSKTDTSAHMGRNNLMLLVIHGNDMMNLVHLLYQKAKDEA